MAKNHKNQRHHHETSQDSAEKKKQGNEKLVEETKEELADTLKEEKESGHKAEKHENHDENRDANDTEQKIAMKKAQLHAAEPVLEEKDPEPAAKKPSKSKKERKIDRNPLNWVRHIGTRALSGIAGLPSRVAAKFNHIVARPQQLVSGKFYKDLGKNVIKTPGAMVTTVTGAVYKPHRDKVKFEDNFKDYGPTFGPDAKDKNWFVRNGKKALWFGGKFAMPTLTAGTWSLFPKFFANVGRGLNHVIHETFEGIRDSKWHWNPKNWNLKTWKFSKTKESFGKAFSRNKKGKSPEGKTIALSPKEEKKAA